MQRELVHLSHLDELEAEAVHIMDVTVALSP